MSSPNLTISSTSLDFSTSSQSKWGISLGGFSSIIATGIIAFSGPNSYMNTGTLEGPSSSYTYSMPYRNGPSGRR